MPYQKTGEVSWSVQALCMALMVQGPILDALQDQGMMYDFVTGVEELAHAAITIGYCPIMVGKFMAIENRGR